ncbi:transglycosylase SLT domain-containing protein [Bilophila wadsworthia]
MRILKEWLETLNAIGAAVLVIVLVVFLFFIDMSLAAGSAHAAETTIPRAALQYRAQLTREARAVWGMEAPVAIFAAQIHTESWWRNDTVSAVGAQGLAQFMPSTARWLPTVAPETGTPAPFNPAWSLRACVTYDKWLYDRLRPMRAASLAVCDRMAFTLSGYNGGIGWVGKDRALAARTGRNPDRWFGHVSDVNAGRNKSAIKENRRYVTLIFQRQSAYVNAGWGPGVNRVEAP